MRAFRAFAIGCVAIALAACGRVGPPVRSRPPPQPPAAATPTQPEPQRDGAEQDEEEQHEAKEPRS